MTQKANVLKVKFDEAKGLLEKIDEEGNRDKYAALLTEIKQLKSDVEAETELKSFESFFTAPATEPKAVDDAAPESYQPAKVDERKSASLGDYLINDKEYKSHRSGGRINRTIEAKSVLTPAQAKATFGNTGGALTSYDRQMGIIAIGQQRLTVADLLAKGETTAPVIRYMRENTYTNASTIVAEGATKPEATFDLVEVDAPVKKIAVTAKVTDEMFADFPQVRDYINNRMGFMIGQTEEAQLLNGSGAGGNMTGLLNTAGIQTQAKGADSNADAIFKAITKIRSIGFFEPDGIVINPTDWQLLRLAKDGQGQYYGGGPFTNAYGNGPFTSVDMFWGLKVVVTTAISAGTALVGAYNLGAQVFYRQGLTVETTNSNEDDFKKNLVAIRVEQREALAVYRPKAFCTVTAIV